MAGPPKMIIITADEDIIQKFSLNKAADTHIIDLDNDKQVITMAKDNNNIINMTLLAELTELNSNNDQTYKRALNSSHHKQSKSAKGLKKMNLICTICGDRATGYNYDALSCASCKSFFRRNAHQNLEKLRCLTGQEQCSVAHDLRRKCQKCRLNRCFAMGMRRDFILSAEDKQLRKERLEENRNNSLKQHPSTTESSNLSESIDEIDQLLMDMEDDDDTMMEDISSKILTSEDWTIIENVRSSFQSTFSDEFENLHADDRFILVKYNLLPMFPISKCYHYSLKNEWSLDEQSEEAIKHRQFYILCFEASGLRYMFLNLVSSLIELIEQDFTFLSLLLTVLIFSQGLSMNEDEPALKDPLGVYRAQIHYTKLLWNYLVNKQDEMKACNQFTRLISIIFRMQTGARQFRDFFREHFRSSNTVDKIEPLMQTVLNIS